MNEGHSSLIFSAPLEIQREVVCSSISVLVALPFKPTFSYFGFYIKRMLKHIAKWLLYGVQDTIFNGECCSFFYVFFFQGSAVKRPDGTYIYFTTPVCFHLNCFSSYRHISAKNPAITFYQILIHTFV